MANLLENEGGISDVDVLCAAVLHDTIEDNETTPEELSSLFGPAIARIVREVTDDKSLPGSVRKQLQIDHATDLSHQAKPVKLADKICMLRDLHSMPLEPRPIARRPGFVDWSASAIARLRGTYAKLEAIFEGLVAQRERILQQYA